MRIGPSALVAACLWAGSAMAQPEPAERGKESDSVPDPVAMVRIPPELVREETCAMTFTIRDDGSVDAETMLADCTDPALETRARTALARWLYNPRIVDGKAVSRPGVTTTMRFPIPE
jgi:hypothetical protein